MISKTLLLSALVAYTEARFGQEQVPISAISAVQGGNPGQAATIAGAAISDLLGAANACAKVQRADQIVTELGNGADAIAAAIGMLTAEKNTNPFANNNTQKLCADPTLPATAELRGITPLIDPDVDTDGAVAALSKQSAGAPLNADGLSIFDLVTAAVGDLGGKIAGDNAAGNAAAGGNANNGNANQNANNNQNQGANNNQNQGANNNQNQGANNNQNQGANNNQGANQNANQGAACNANSGASNNATADAGNNNNNQAAAGNGNNGQAATGGSSTSLAGVDFGQCTPTIIFEGGLGGRPATEFTYQIADTLARGGQQEALNPAIITNALCNQLVNVCNANDAAVAACKDAKTQADAQAQTARDKKVADVFNSALGFAGAVTNPDGGPANPAAATGAANARRGMKFVA